MSIDPEKSVLYDQAGVPEVAELAQILSYFPTVAEMERNPVYRDQVQNLGLNGNGRMAFLAYPILQAADILIVNARYVPVGKDQAPHLEIACDLARRFNAHVGRDVLPVPRMLLTESPHVPGLDGRKMSKSYDNAITLAHTPEETEARVACMLTDTKRPYRKDPGHPDECSCFALHTCMTSNDLQG